MQVRGKWKEKNPIIHLQQECKATVFRSPRVDISATNNLTATSLAKQKTGDETFFFFFLTQTAGYSPQAYLPRHSHHSAKQTRKFCGKLKILPVANARDKRGEKRNRRTCADQKKISCLGVGLFLPGCTSRVLSQCRVESSRSNQRLHARSGTPQQTVRELCAFFFSSPRKAAGGSVHVHGWLHWRCFAHMTVVTTTQEPRTKRSRGGGDIYTRQHRRVLQCSFRNRVRIGDNSGVHWSGGGGGDAVSVAEGGKGARRDGRGGGWWARATTARTWVLSRCRARQRRSLAAARRPAASSAPGRCRTSAQPVCDCCLVQCR